MGGGALIFIGGLLIALGSGRHNCDREREELANARRRLAEINETLEDALDDMKAHEDEIRELEADLESYRKSKERGSVVEGGITYYAHDGERISAADLNTETAYLEERIRIAKEAEANDEARAKEWHERFRKAEQEVRKAEEALAKCLGEIDAPTPPPRPESPGPSAPSGPSRPGVAAPPPEHPEQTGCEEGSAYSRVGTPEKITPVVDFSVIVTVHEGSQRKVAEARALSLGLGEAVTDLDILGKSIGAAGAASSIRSALGGLASGEYVMGTAGLVKGTAEGAMASGLTTVSVPTSAPEAVVEVLKGAANLGKWVADTVGKLLEANQIYDVHLTLFQQTIVATPYLNYRCVDGRWQCEKVWQYSVGKLRKKGKPRDKSFILDSDLNRYRMQAEIRRLGRIAQRNITDSVKARAEFDAKHQPGPCQ
jgi:hypothetical protein